MARVKVCVLRTAGINCDMETAFAFRKAGAEAELVHVNKIISKKKDLQDYQVLAIPGGFTYGDDLGAGKILANELRFKLAEALRRFIADGKLIIGICNGFQVLVKSGLLPGGPGLRQETSLIINDSGKFEDRWVYLRSASQSASLPEGDQVRAQASPKGTKTPVKCVWVKDIPKVIYLPVAHGEGKFVVGDNAVLDRLRRNSQVVFQYCDRSGGLTGYPDNPNGSQENIAGICDDTGRILGLMPHPERHMENCQHPRRGSACAGRDGDGILIFKNGVEYVRRHL